MRSLPGGNHGPLMLCLRCRAAYDLRESDFRKLVTLSQTGRSTATTVLSTSGRDWPCHNSVCTRPASPSRAC